MRCSSCDLSSCHQPTSSRSQAARSAPVRPSGMAYSEGNGSPPPSSGRSRAHDKCPAPCILLSHSESAGVNFVDIGAVDYDRRIRRHCNQILRPPVHRPETTPDRLGPRRLRT